MKQESQRDFNNTVIERPRTRAFIKQEAEEDKERFTRVLRGRVREGSPQPDEDEESDKDFKRSAKTPRKNRYCRICNFTYDSRSLYLRHKSQTHNTGPLPNIDIKSLHCNTCNLKVTTISSYRQHMLKHHSIKVPVIYPKRDPLLGPDNFCVTCNRKFSTKLNYRYHLFRLHNGPPIIATYKPSTFDIPTSYCKICDKKYRNRDSLGTHMKQTHDICLSPPRKSEDPNVKINIEDPNNHCALCDVTFSEKSNYLRHLITAHIKSLPKLSEGVECNGVDNEGISCRRKQCTECNRVFYTRNLYRMHLEKVHNTAIPKRQLRMPVIFPNHLDPNNHCSSCDITCSNQSEYKSHLKDNHDISSASRIRDIPAQFTICKESPIIDYDIHYCNTCNTNYTRRLPYRRHLTSIHGISMPTTCRRFPLRTKGSLDIDESNLRCTACNKTYSSQLNYRKHLKTVHHVGDSHDKIMMDRESGNNNIDISTMSCLQEEIGFCKKLKNES